MTLEPDGLAHKKPLDRPEQEPDVLDARTIHLVALGLLAAILLCSAFAWLIIRERVGATAPGGAVASRGGALPAEINHIETYDFERPPPRDHAAALERLKSYGWADAEHRLVHIPIDRAIALYLAGARVPSAAASADDPYAQTQPEATR
jgi:hypothetical protein